MPSVIAPPSSVAIDALINLLAIIADKKTAGETLAEMSRLAKSIETGTLELASKSALVEADLKTIDDLKAAAQKDRAEAEALLQKRRDQETEAIERIRHTEKELDSKIKDYDTARKQANDSQTEYEKKIKALETERADLKIHSDEVAAMKAEYEEKLTKLRAVVA